MKKGILYLLCLTVAFFSCENSDDTVFDETSDARLNAALASYEKQLVEAQYGWNAVMYPGGGGSYGFYMKFNDQNRVVMYSDFTDESAAKSKESSYRLKAMQTPSLIFDTYSYLHVLSDPDDEVNGGILGEGLQSDFEFSIFPDSVGTDRITFVGRKNQSRLVLTRATQPESVAYTSGNLAKSLLFNNISKYQAYFKRITLGGVTYEITVSPVTRTITLTWLEGSVPRTFSSTYYFNSSGLAFVKPLVNGSRTINGFSNFTWNASTIQLGFSGGGAAGTVVSATKPLSVDLAASRRWWQEPIASGGDWRTAEGFHINGVDDALGVKNLTFGDGKYAFYVYQPGLTATYDAFGPVFYTADSYNLPYAHLPARPTFTSDGRIIFKPYDVSTDVPASGPAVNSANVLYEASGYYLIKTSETTYDMVGAKDAKTWITWQ